MDIEKDLFRLRREMTSHYTKGNYPSALDCAETIEKTAADLYGAKTSIYASCLNNTALMLKMTGETKAAAEKYTKALHVYEDTVGRNHQSYASVLANVGILYKLMAQEKEAGKERDQLIRNAEMAVMDSYALRVEILGEHSKEVFESQIQYASVLSMKGDIDKAEDQLTSTLKACRKAFKEKDVDSIVTATVLNNLGHLLKQQSQGRYEEAQTHYMEALSIRKAFLGEKHPDTVVSKHNLAELFMAMGKQKEAMELQDEIMEGTNLVGVYEDGNVRVKEEDQRRENSNGATMRTREETPSPKRRGPD